MDPIKDPPPSYDSVVKIDSQILQQSEPNKSSNEMEESHQDVNSNNISTETESRRKSVAIFVNDEVYSSTSQHKPMEQTVDSDDVRTNQRSVDTNSANIDCSSGKKDDDIECISTETTSSDLISNISCVHQEEENMPNGLWSRLKHSLEGLALFIIQILD